ncbi:MAG TPA: GIY-YIG nuclease family protein [Ignavibacteriales bacterium]|nr:GIY-YIG nuclease family protein [Ignavibacteriales bacterium]
MELFSFIYVLHYILKSLSDNSHYYGQTENLQKRVEEHNLGLSGYTKKHIPWKLIYYEEFSTRSEAMKREKFFKSIEGHKWLKENGII